jgi:Major capsid protein N-terminus/Large eukaryotic DNA virus major capsid protein
MKSHTNFAMESFTETFNSRPFMDPSGGTFTCKIGRYGDLLQEIYFSFILPDIYSDDNLRFRWVDNIAQVMINTCSVRLGNQLIDQSYGEWMEIWNELTLDAGKRTAFNSMTGNTDDFTAPRMAKDKVVIVNNRLSYVNYPAATATTPSIRGRRLYVPMPFWFCKNPALALPIVAFEGYELVISIEIRGVYDLYQVYDITTNTYVSPNEYQSRNRNSPATFDCFTKFGGGGPVQVDLNAYLECNQILLDNAERALIGKSDLDYLVDRVYRIETGGLLKNNVVDLQLTKPIKELVWVLRRSDAITKNEWTNFTRAIPADGSAPIMASAKIIWNGLDRLQEKPESFFNVIQPYQYHTNAPRAGIYLYSFSLFPEKTFASGAFNASMINTIQLYLTTNHEAGDPDYDIVVYSRYVNIFRVRSGHGEMAFA